MTSTVLVTGGTGTVGSHVLRELTDRECQVRALVRDPESANIPDSENVIPVEFDFTRPETWGQAFEEGDSLFLVRPPAISRVGDHILPAIDAAIRCGVSHVTVLSVVGAEKNPLLPHRRIERHVQNSDATWTFLRASFFMQNFHEEHAHDIVEHDEIFVPAGTGKTSFIDARDIAAVAALTLTEDGHENTAYDLTGSEALTYAEAAAVFTDVLDREITYGNPGLITFAWRMLARGNPLGFVLVMGGIYTTARLGLAGRVTDDVELLLGREPRTLAAYVEDYREEFTKTAREVAHVEA